MQSALKVYDEIFPTLIHKSVIGVYTDNQEYKDIFKHSKKLILESDPLKADIVFMTERTRLLTILQDKFLTLKTKKKPIIFVTDYRLMKYSLDIVGAFYWRKGRSQLLFIDNRLKDHNITLPKKYESFTVDEL